MSGLGCLREWLRPTCLLEPTLLPNTPGATHNSCHSFRTFYLWSKTQHPWQWQPKETRLPQACPGHQAIKVLRREFRPSPTGQLWGHPKDVWWLFDALPNLQALSPQSSESIMAKNQNWVAPTQQVLTSFPHHSMDLCLPLFPSSLPHTTLRTSHLPGSRYSFHLLIPLLSLLGQAKILCCLSLMINYSIMCSIGKVIIALIFFW